MGLLVAPNVFEPAGAITNATLLDELATRTLALAADLYSKYGPSIHGWYLPIEPNNKTIRSPQIAQIQGDWIGRITDALHTAYPGIPVMSSPSMPTAILDGKTAMQFVDQFAPVFERAHVDVWNIQDGFKMTAWTPAQEVAALLHAQQLAQQHGAEVWADLYTPGPNSTGTAQVTTSKMIPFLTAIGSAGIRLSSYMFSAHMNPDTTLTGGAARHTSYQEYLAYCQNR
jgi:hypothetical protein